MSGRVISRSEASALGVRLRQQGRSIAFTNGCFDLLHVGHVRYLAGARAQADALVVGVNNDASVANLKGPGRPLLTADARAELVAALEGVGYVVIFDEPNVASLLEELRPDVHCKGTDYTEETVPERDVMKRLGGAVRIVGDPKNHSTRDILADIARRNKPA